MFTKYGRLQLLEIRIVYNENFAQTVWREDYNVQLFPFVIGEKEEP